MTRSVTIKFTIQPFHFASSFVCLTVGVTSSALHGIGRHWDTLRCKILGILKCIVKYKFWDVVSGTLYVVLSVLTPGNVVGSVLI
uniref:Uncharacterized protein n=1 Tax=Oryza rufipogon TaxID=4529 RepID=A0A0E0Q1P0_ORYRU